MARGGGGGFGGGGFGGGGFRGGGFRGGSSTFRSGRVRSSGRPFGRTGSRRTVSRAPRSSSSRRHGYGRHYRRRWWGGYHRPWYRSWWHWHWWWGYPYRSWYRAPVYWGGGLAFGIIALLIILPLIGLAFIPFPFTNSSSEGTVTYSDTQTLYFNEYWYEKENMIAGQQIQYSMQAYSELTFLIWDQPFESFPETNTPLTGNHNGSLTVQGEHDYQYLGYFLKPGSTLEFEFTVSGGEIEFFIADADDLNRWNNWETIYPTVYYVGEVGDDNTFSVTSPQDYYLVWYNPGSSPIDINYDVDYSVVGVYDFSDADVYITETELVQQSTFNVPHDGTWYFFIYFDPFANPAESVEITFDVSYDTGVTYKDKWIDFQPILLIIGGIIVFILIIAILQRSTSKKTTPPSAPAAAATTTLSTTTTEPVTKNKCHRCNFVYKPGDVYCTNCGGKITGRDYGVSTITTPSTSKNCKSCGNHIQPGSRFCKNCGAKVEQKEKTYKYFPDERKSFFCQLDNEKHPSTDSAYECDQCSRKICGDCFSNISKTGLSVCPYCKGELSKIQ